MIEPETAFRFGREGPDDRDDQVIRTTR